MPRCGAAADGCCAPALPFAAAAARSAPRGPGSTGAPPAPAAPQRLQPPPAAPRPPPPRPLPPPFPPPRPPSRPPAAMNPPAGAGGEEPGAAGGCRGAEGGGEAVGAAGVPEEPGLGEESLEEKLRSLTFRKQVSYRWVPVPVPCCPPCRRCAGARAGRCFHNQGPAFLPLCLDPVPAVPSTPAPSSWERTCVGMWAAGFGRSAPTAGDLLAVSSC